MINKRQTSVNIEKLKAELTALNARGLAQVEVDEIIQFAKMYQVYEAAQNEVATKLENLDAEFQLNYNHNPIHHMDGRMKSPESLVGKMQKKGLERTVKTLTDNVFDIAGLRVITNYIDDIYTIERLLTHQSDVTVLKRKDYVETPKASGYRSLHLVVTVPVFLSTGVVDTPVEIQIRTVGMDMWASLEHKLRYKTDDDRAEEHAQQLERYAGELFDIERNLQAIHQDL
ncbi:GTP pyrophosphokinase family protein [Weissella cibaria]|uniref:GTP pyrophosphokinase n=1 Tax=Weissella cibaria TaxID=137591 RepID=UPI0011939BE2|nr:GTP pyrophosphokinase family protein [Weissella cibaria]MBU7544603.1 GTP pyrophosphokinase family protein [Weissella cibaria]MBU7562143.1 GTP pyrophosphokinase family protein [Weissella cibaria]MCA1356294.1 GTP pyrophosphokinase family protein [Weissella cibaria]MCT0020063.1 GTP pyrophosphokinase family protein [Weissella cibaria]MCT0956740.1 GTP pyrophosphokinase family protein [Weissella cibaria]